MNARRRSLASQRGAVLVETLVVMVPVVGFFLGVCQVTELCTADLVVQRAASAAARAAIVVLPDSPEYYPTDDSRQQEIRRAADMILRTNGSYRANSAQVVTLRAVSGDHDPLVATVSGQFACAVCPGGNVRLTASSTRIYQGAQYSYEFGTASDFNPLPQP